MKFILRAPVFGEEIDLVTHARMEAVLYMKHSHDANKAKNQGLITVLPLVTAGIVPDLNRKGNLM